MHGAWSDGSNWRHIIPLLHKEGYKVRSVQNPLTSLEDDIEKTNDLIDAQDGKVLLVGHSYGGAVISGAGNNDKVVGMVYIAAFAPDKGESLGSISAQKTEQPSGRASIYRDSKGFLWITYDEYRKSFCHDVNETDALVASLAQKPIHSQCFGSVMGDPAWRNKPTWYQVSSNDHMILPETQREMAERMNPEKIIYLEASHFSLASKPQEVAQLILEAAKSCE
ncbi:alpha/beta hydrolase [Chryseobacterium paridis]|uniref:alpha/beta hydrolase n=1 Tax=Chryseobacterium paridis TaxID=2800328 RepID=UPI00293D5F06|nr:alpha/beta hydrolase [Chryseobacterium paridis]